MKDKASNAENEDLLEVCFGQMVPTKNGIDFPPKYAHRLRGNFEDSLIIPLTEEKQNENKSDSRKHKDINNGEQTK